jgi:hypothetical protein
MRNNFETSDILQPHDYGLKANEILNYKCRKFFSSCPVIHEFSKWEQYKMEIIFIIKLKAEFKLKKIMVPFT